MCVCVYAGSFWKVDDLSADESQHAAVVVESSAESKDETKAAGEKGEGLLASSAEGSAVPM